MFAYLQQSKRVSLNLALRCNNGIENKGIVVQSSEPISVMGNNQLDGWSQDVFLVNALWNMSTEFLVVSREPREKAAVFSVFAAYDSTIVNIWKPAVSGHVHWQTFTLNRLDTFTFKETTDPTGYKIVTNKAVSVLSGSQTDVIVSGMSGFDHMCVSLPPVDFLVGTEYYIIPITIRNNPGAYHVRVVAVYDSTIVSDLKDDGNHITSLNGGQYFENGPVTSGTPVTALRCSQPCIVMQYNMGPAYDSTAGTDTFQMWIPSLHHHTKYVNFITPHNEDDTAMQNTLVVLTWSTVTSAVLVDGVSVDNWVEFWAGSEISYAAVIVGDGEHDIVFQGKPPHGFLAWLYGRNAGDVDAYGTLLGAKTGKILARMASKVDIESLIISVFWQMFKLPQ